MKSLGLKAAAVAFFPHHIEHLAPCCQILDAPLIAFGKDVADLASTCFPLNQVIQITDDCLTKKSWPNLISNPVLRRHLSSYDVLVISHLFSRDALRELFGSLKRVPPRIIFCPHGFSEKAQNWSSAAAYQDISIFYGQFGCQQLVDWGIPQKTCRSITTGDFRYSYFKQHRDFFSELLNSLDLPFSEFSSTLLYAPTWHDAIGSSSVIHAISPLIDDLPKDHLLLIKPHPLLTDSDLAELKQLVQGSRNTALLRNFPVSFPILERVDAYIGDMSALAYDFLKFDRPMVFLNQTYGTDFDASKSRLFECGAVINRDKYHFIYQALEEEKASFQKRSNLRNALYNYVYDPSKLDEELKDMFVRALQGPAPRWMFAHSSPRRSV